MPVSRKHRNMKTSSRSRKISKSKNARRSKRNRKSMRRMRGGYKHTYITNNNGGLDPTSNIVEIVNKENGKVQYGRYVDNGGDGEHVIRIGKLNDQDQLVLNDNDPLTTFKESEFTISDSNIDVYM